MMRAKTLKTVVTFATTSDALALEAMAQDSGLPGRVIPVPSAIDAGCGLAWCVDRDERDELLEGLEKRHLTYEGVHEVMMY